MLHRILVAGACIALLTPLGACSRHSAAQPRASNASRGAIIFSQQCSACHGSSGVGGPIGPSLRTSHLSLHAIRVAIEHPQPPMPKLFPDQLTARDVVDVTAYVAQL